MKTRKIELKEEKEFEPVSIEITFESIKEMKDLRSELNNTSFKLFELLGEIIYDIEG